MVKIDKKTLEDAINSSHTRREVLLKLGRADTSSSYNLLRRLIQRYHVNASHLLTGTALMTKLHSDGKLLKRTNNEIFCEHSKIARSVLKQRILRDNIIPYICGVCGNPPQWNGQELTLILDHINGVRDDNRQQNLRFVCPNCEAQLPTHCRGNHVKKRKQSRSWGEYQADKRAKYVAAQQQLIPLLLSSDIDFMQFGWATKVAVIINQPVQKVNRWMKQFMPEIYLTQCFKRKNAGMV